MIEEIWLVVRVVLALIGILVWLHYIAFVIAWGWAKGIAKVPVNNVTTVNLNGRLDGKL